MVVPSDHLQAFIRTDPVSHSLIQNDPDESEFQTFQKSQ